MGTDTPRAMNVMDCCGRSMTVCNVSSSVLEAKNGMLASTTLAANNKISDPKMEGK